MMDLSLTSTDEEFHQNFDSNPLSEISRNMSYNAIITPGEASESDEEEEELDDQTEKGHSSGQQNHQSSRNRKISDMSQSQRSAISDDSSSIGDTNKYNTLLHKKLKEKNEQLKRELTDIACGPYNMATKEVGNITKQLIQSQKMVQNVSASLRKVSKELTSLEETIASIKNDKNLLFKDFLIQTNTEQNVNQTNVTEN